MEVDGKPYFVYDCSMRTEVVLEEEMTDEEFRTKISELCDRHSDKEIASLMKVAQSTVLKWKSGQANPHPKMKDQIVKTLQQRLDRK